MKQVNVRFERDRALELIDVLIRASERDAQVKELMEHVSGQPPDVITVTDTAGKARSIVTDDIISASVTKKLTLLATEDGNYTVRLPLQNLEEMLDADKFLRVSRHELINTDKIKQYEFLANGTLRLMLSGGVETWASRRCIPAIRKLLNGTG